MKLIVLLMLTALVPQIKTDESLVLDNNQFLIYNKVYHKARLAQFSTTSDREIGTFEHGLHPDQLWTLEPHPSKKGCYYMVNEKYTQHRITNYKHQLIIYDGPHYSDQLFKFVPSGKNDGFYYIYSCRYENDRLAKLGFGDKEVGFYSGAKSPEQLWRLVPRFKANFFTDQVFHFDNRQASNPITREVTVTTGMKRSTTTTIRNQSTFKYSIEASMSTAFNLFDFGVTATTEFSAELESTFADTNEQTWSKTEKITFIIPPGKNFKVMQHQLEFEGQFHYDSCTLLTDIKIFESDTNQFEDPDDFIISRVQ